MIKRIAHIGITITNLDRSIDFYENILGLKFQGEITMKGKEADFLFNKNNCEARIAYLNSTENSISPPVELIQFLNEEAKIDKAELDKTSISEICFEVEDIDKTYKRLLNKGVQFLSEPQDFDFSKIGFGKSRAVYFRDPDGIILELIETVG